MANKAKNFYGMELYEDWMDYRGAPNSQRSNSIVSRGELAKSQARSRFQLHNAYAESVVSEDAQEKKDQVPVDQKEEVRETRSCSTVKSTKPTVRSKSATSFSLSNKEKKALIKSIVEDFGPFYDWITNGRNDDMDEDIIKKLLFKK